VKILFLIEIKFLLRHEKEIDEYLFYDKLIFIFIILRLLF